MHTPLKRLLAVLTFVVGLTALLPVTANAKPADGPSMARFEGRVIDLRRGWGEATACASDGETTDCFRTESAMNSFLASKTAPSASGSFGTLSSCASPVRLYDNTSYGAPVLSLYSRGVWLNLAGYGFDNKTASYIIGDCGAYFADGASGGGTWYPGNTAAYASSPDMGATWRDRVSSVYLT